MLRPGKAGANTAAEHVAVLEAALAQLPDESGMETLARAESCGATHHLLHALREYEIRFPVGCDLTEPVREAILAMPEEAWRLARTANSARAPPSASCTTAIWRLGLRGPGPSAVASVPTRAPSSPLLTTRVSAAGLHHRSAGLRHRCPRGSHRAHARIEDRIRCGKDAGLRSFPFHESDANQVWLEPVLAAQDLIAFFQRPCLVGEAQQWEPKRLRYRLLHTTARLVRGGRRLIIRGSEL